MGKRVFYRIFKRFIPLFGIRSVHMGYAHVQARVFFTESSVIKYATDTLQPSRYLLRSRFVLKCFRYFAIKKTCLITERCRPDDVDPSVRHVDLEPSRPFSRHFRFPSLRGDGHYHCYYFRCTTVQLFITYLFFFFIPRFTPISIRRVYTWRPLFTSA